MKVNNLELSSNSWCAIIKCTNNTYQSLKPFPPIEDMKMSMLSNFLFRNKKLWSFVSCNLAFTTRLQNEITFNFVFDIAYTISSS